MNQTQAFLKTISKITRMEVKVSIDLTYQLTWTNEPGHLKTCLTRKVPRATRMADLVRFWIFEMGVAFINAQADAVRDFLFEFRE